MEQAEGDPDFRPDTVFISNVIRAWAKSGRMEAPEMAEGLLQLMHNLYEIGLTESGPNTLSYGATMEAWSQCCRHSHREAACEAMEKLLQAMEQVVPDRVSICML